MHTSDINLANVKTNQVKETLTFSASVTNNEGKTVGYVVGDGLEIITSVQLENATLCLAKRSDFVNSNGAFQTLDFAVGDNLAVYGSSKCEAMFDQMSLENYICCPVTKSGIYYPIERVANINTEDNNNGGTVSSASSVTVSICGVLAILSLVFC